MFGVGEQREGVYRALNEIGRSWGRFQAMQDLSNAHDRFGQAVNSVE